ncbi:MAG: hypothetical protein ABWY25_05310 [Paenisporosarcina sp.]
MSKVIVHKNRVNIITVSLGIDVSGDDISSEIRSEPDSTSPLIATWDVTFDTDGSDGELILTMPELEITANSGYMDIKRVTGGMAVPVFDRPLEVDFRGTVTE